MEALPEKLGTNPGLAEAAVIGVHLARPEQAVFTVLCRLVEKKERNMLMQNRRPPRQIAFLSIALLAGIAGFCGLSSVLTGAPPPGKGNGGKDTSAAYHLTVLAGFPDSESAQASAYGLNHPNANGRALAVGQATTSSGDWHAAVWEFDTSGQLLATFEIPSLSGTVSNRAVDVNDAGFIVGNTHHSSTAPAFVAVPDGNGTWTTYELPDLGVSNVTASAINNFGDIVGKAVDVDGIMHGVLWHVDNSGTISGPLDLGTSFFPSEIDENEPLLMSGRTVTGEAALAWFDESGHLQIETLGTLQGDDTSAATTLNNSGEVAGWSHESFGSNEAFVLRPDGEGMIGLGTLGGTGSAARDINDFGEIIGSALDGKKDQRATRWINDVATDLNELHDGGNKYELRQAWAINDMGQIVGSAESRRGGLLEPRGFLLTPTP